MKKIICKMLYNIGAVRLAYRISPSLTVAVMGEKLREALMDGLIREKLGD